MRKFGTVFLLGMVLVGCRNENNIDGNKINVIYKDEVTKTSSGIFDIPEIQITPSPTSSSDFELSNEVNGLDVSPIAPIVAFGNYNPALNKSYISILDIGKKIIIDSIEISGKGKIIEVVYHPRASAIFAIGENQGKYEILRLTQQSGAWKTTSIYSSQKKIKGLAVCPRPFVTDNGIQYRLFFGINYENDLFKINSLTENGGREYQVVGPKDYINDINGDGFVGSGMVSKNAVPATFHPGGSEMIWRDQQNRFWVANYNRKFWDTSRVIKAPIKGGDVQYTSNGLNLIHWEQEKRGISIYSLLENKSERILENELFLNIPKTVCDGKGVVGLTKEKNKYKICFRTIQIPLADVINAWMFAENKEECSLLNKNFGLFRNTRKNNQLYELYDEENYHCNDYDRSTTTRPYLVTTDIFWEIFGAAYEGLMIVNEKEVAIPSFWNFIKKANAYFKSENKKNHWTEVFETIEAISEHRSNNNELEKILSASINENSFISGEKFDYTQLKPRFHYTSDEKMQDYFKGFKYFTMIYAAHPEILQELNSMPKEIRQLGLDWIKGYTGFISGSRHPLIWQEAVTISPFATENSKPTIFPLSWGFDNEVLNKSLYHPDYPSDRQIVKSNGEGRSLPTGLDFAAAMGNLLADSLLGNEYNQYLNLRRVIGDLKDKYAKLKPMDQQSTLYDKWINSIGVQLKATEKGVNEGKDKNIVNAKRLQTGLATWATLRHATGLVNETTAAECGEGGFEEILLRAPRGFIEPDPATFLAIADLFESLAKFSSKINIGNAGTSKDGYINKLKETAASANTFAEIAKKELEGKPLTNEECELVLFIGRVAEHDFLLFKSLSKDGNALANPDPIAKIADVSSSENGYLMVAVGNPLEFDYIVPYYGRHQITKGSIYSYYEFVSPQLKTDQEWDKEQHNHLLPSYIQPFCTDRITSYPARTGLY